MAVEFETGSHSKGYTLTSIRAALSNAVPADGVRVRLFSASFAGAPGSSLSTFDNPTISNGTKTFTAPANTTLQKDTQYFLVFDSTAADANYGVGATESDALTSAVAGWELNASRRFTFSGGSWNEHYATLRVEINGAIKPNATGQPGITGFPQAGESLTATAGDINDVDGLPAFPSGFSFQWVRVDGTTETDIPGATSSTYDPVAADVGKHVKVKVSFTDNAGVAEGPLESDPTDDAVLAARTPCPSRSDWCTEMTVRQGSGSLVPLGFSGGSYGSIDDDTFDDGTLSYEVNEIWLLVDPLSGTNTVAVTLDAFLPRGSVFHIGGKKFTADASSEQGVTGQYRWPVPPGLSWVEGQKVTVSLRFAPPVVTIAPVEPSAVYARDDLEFVVSRTVNTLNAIDVSVELTQYRTYLEESALSHTVTIPAGASSAVLTIPESEYGAMDDGVWTTRPSKIKATIKKRTGYVTGSRASASVTMHIAMTVGFGPYESSFRVDEGSGSLDVTFYATSGEGMGAPTQRVEVQYSTVDGTATAPGDYEARSGTVYIEPSDFKCIAGGYDGCDLARDGHRATKTVTLNIIHEDSSVEGDETFRLLLHKGSSNGPEVVYVDDRGIRGVSCTPGSTCTAKVTIVDNDGITQPTENPDWTLTGSTRIFSGTSSAHRRPLMSGTETAVRCLNGSSPFSLTDHNGHPVTGDITYSLHVAKGYAGYSGITQRWAVPGMFSIDGTGQIRTKVGVDYPNTESPQGNLRTIYANVRATHTASKRYAEYRQGFIILHPTSTHFDDRNPTCASMQLVPDPLTAELRNLPASHDGANSFTFQLAFSDSVTIEPDEMRDHALLVSDATVTSASRVDGRSDLWDLTVEPAGTANVGIIVPQGRACSEQGALCTSDGRTLSSTVQAQLIQYVPPNQERHAPGTGLTASFENAPASHDGATIFTIELAFSEAVFNGDEPFDKNQRISDAVAVTNGVLKGRRRVNPQEYDRWILRIEPSGHGDVTLRLPATTGGCSAPGAICTPDGTALSADTTATVEGPGLPGLSIADAEVQEVPGAKLVFTITLSHAATETVTFDIATSDGSAIAGEDYRGKDTSRTMAAGTTSRVFQVPVHDDAINEGDETLTVTISNVTGATLTDGTATGTIKNSDPMPKAWTIRFGRTIASQIVDAVGARLDGGHETDVTVGGINLMGGALEDEEETRPLGLPEWETHRTLEPAAQTMTPGEILLGSSFSLSAGQTGPGSTAIGVWGHFATSQFESTEEDVDHEGDVLTGMIGADIEWEHALAGTVLSHSTGDGGYTGEGAIAGAIESTLTGVYPYGRIDLNARVGAWALAGAGSGSITISPDGGARIETGASMRMGALGLHGRVLEPAGDGGLALNVRTDALWVRTTTERTQGMAESEADATRVRLIVEGRRTFEVGSGATISPTGEIGLRHDAGDAETGAGLEMGAGLRYASGPLTIDGRVRGLIAHEDDGYREWGAGGSVRLEPDSSGRGLSLSVAPVWGAPASDTERLWGATDARALDPNRDFDAEGRLEAQVGYGMVLPHDRGLITPYAGLTLADEGSRTMRTGARWDIAPNAALGVEATRSHDDTHALGLRLRMSW